MTNKTRQNKDKDEHEDHDKIIQDKTRQNNTRPRQYNIIRDMPKPKQDATRHDNTRKYEKIQDSNTTRQEQYNTKARQDDTRPTQDNPRPRPYQHNAI